MKFKMRKGKGAVNRFTDENGVVHYPGDIVDLPISYKGQTWLEPIDAEVKVIVPAAKVEKIKPETSNIPLSKKKIQTKAAETQLKTENTSAS